MENKITAVDWLRENLELYGDPTHLSLTWETLDELLEEAKQMEKHQIIEAYCEGDDNVGAEEYYNKTYQNEKKD